MDQALTHQNFWNKSQKFFFTETNAKNYADQSQNHAQASTGTKLEYQIFSQSQIVSKDRIRLSSTAQAQSFRG